MAKINRWGAWCTRCLCLWSLKPPSPMVNTYQKRRMSYSVRWIMPCMLSNKVMAQKCCRISHVRFWGIKDNTKASCRGCLLMKQKMKICQALGWTPLGKPMPLIQAMAVKSPQISYMPLAVPEWVLRRIMG